jgi:hypothetical protein
MEDDAEILNRIARLKGQIEQKKQGTQTHQHGQHRPHPTPYRGASRWAPYGRGRGGGRGGYTPPVKNLTLVNNDSTPALLDMIQNGNDDDGAMNFATSNTHQLMNQGTYEREKKQKEEEHRVTKRQKINRKERSHLITHATERGSREILIEGLRFQLRDDGSKLIRLPGECLRELRTEQLCLIITDPSTSAKETPKVIKVANVAFFRTKNGNLVRANAVKGLTRYLLRHNVSEHVSRTYVSNYTRTNLPSTKAQCENFTKHGTLSPLPPPASFLTTNSTLASA